MWRPGAWLLFAGLFVLAVVATIDALYDGAPGRGAASRTEEAVATARTETEPRAVTAALRDHGVTGVLHVTQRRPEGCRLLALRLPELDAEADVLTPLCRVEAGPNGKVALWDECPRAPIEVLDRNGNLVGGSLDGCAPGWTPSGDLTLVSRGAVVRVKQPCRTRPAACYRPLISAPRLAAEFRASARFPRGGRYFLRELAWLPSGRLAAIVRRIDVTPNDFIAVFDERGELLPTTQLLGPGRLSHIRYVPFGGGEIFARAPPRNSGIMVWDANGALLGPTQYTFEADRAYDVSPNEHWLALASSDSVYIVPTNDVDAFNPIQIRLRVADLAWARSD